MFNFGTILVTVSISQAVVASELPEKEFCNWLTERCPFMLENYRPAANPSKAVDIWVALYVRRLTKMDDVDQTFAIAGSFSFEWGAEVDCLENIVEIIKMEQNDILSDLAKQTGSCSFDHESVWHPNVRHSNAATSPNLIVE